MAKRKAKKTPSKPLRKPSKTVVKARPAAKKPAKRADPKKVAPKKVAPRKVAPKVAAPKKVEPVAVPLAKPGAVPVSQFAPAPVAFEVAFQAKSSKHVAPFALEGHTAFVQALAFSHDGHLLVTGSEDGSVRVWDLANRICLYEKRDHTSAVNCLAFTSDGARLLTASDDQTVKVWSVPAFEVERTLEGHTDYVSEVQPAGPGRAVSAGKDGTLRLWDLETGECLKVMEHGEWILALAASHDGRHALASSDRNVMRLWDLETGEIERVLLDASGTYIGSVMGMLLAAKNTSGIGHENYPKHALFAPDDATFLTCEKELIVWDSAAGKELFRLEGDGWPIGGFAFIPNSRRVFACAHGTVRLFDLDARAVVAQAAWEHQDLHSVAVSLDGRWAACGSSDGPVGLWDLEELSRAGIPDRHLDLPHSIAVTRDGRYVLTGGADRTARLWDTAKGTNLTITTEGLFVKPVCFGLGDRLALVMGDEGMLRVHEAATGIACGEATISDDSRYRPFSELHLLADGRMLVGSTTGPLAIWPLDPVGAPEPFKEDAGQVTAMAVDEAGDLVVTTEYGGDKDPVRLKLWSLRKRGLTRALAFKLKGYAASVALVGDRIVAGTSDGALLILDREGRPLHALEIAAGSYLSSIIALPDGRVVVGASSPVIVDLKAGRIASSIELPEKAGLEAIPGAPSAVVRSDDGISLLDFTANTLSQPCPVPQPHDVAAAGGGQTLAVISRRPDLLGTPLVLRRL
jgi:WD40 repeat protein